MAMLHRSAREARPSSSRVPRYRSRDAWPNSSRVAWSNISMKACSSPRMEDWPSSSRERPCPAPETRPGAAAGRRRGPDPANGAYDGHDTINDEGHWTTKAKTEWSVNKHKLQEKIRHTEDKASLDRCG